MTRDTLGLIAVVLIGFAVGLLLGWWTIFWDEPSDGSQAKTVTVHESTTLQPINNNKTVPLKETHTENNHYYTEPCKLPDTGPTLRRHKAH